VEGGDGGLGSRSAWCCRSVRFWDVVARPGRGSMILELLLAAQFGDDVNTPAQAFDGEDGPLVREIAGKQRIAPHHQHGSLARFFDRADPGNAAVALQ